MKTNLSPAQYWEWRTTIMELEIAKEKTKSAQLEYKLLQKDAENLSIRTQLFLRTRMEAVKDEAGKAKAEYERFKQVLEEDLGQSLNNKVIDDVTFEVRELPDETITAPLEQKEK
jgi:hypothetical protein